MQRRHFSASLASACLLLAPSTVRAQSPFRLGLTPVFLDNNADIIEHLGVALSSAINGAVHLVQRRTYQEVTAALLDGSLDAAWICGYPFLQYRQQISLVGVPVWRDRQLYQSYLIAGPEDDASSLADLRGGVHAFSDPNSNSGFLVTASDLARMSETPEGFFARTIYTYGHRNVVRAVADGLTRSGSVDSYVWETLRIVEPALTARTKVISRSEWLGFPPFATRTDRAASPELRRFAEALQNLHQTEQGRAALDRLFLQRIGMADVSLYDEIAARMADLGLEE